MDFKLVSEYSPTGDQPDAIKPIVQGFRDGQNYQTLLGVTGSGKTFTMALSVKDFVEDVIKRPLDLGNEDHISSPRNARMKGNPSCMATHNLQNHYPLVTGCRCMESVERIGRTCNGAIKTESEGGCRNIVVDRLGDSHHRDAILMKLLRDRQ